MKKQKISNFLTDIKLLVNSIDEVQSNKEIDPDKKMLLANTYYKSLHQKTKEYLKFINL